MPNKTELPIIGNLTGDPELRFIPSGAAVCNFTVAVTPRTFNQQANEWQDGETAFWDCTVWREQAENVAESLQKGMRVIVFGSIKVDKWEDKQTGQQRSKMVIDVDEVGPSLRYATAQVKKSARGGDGGGFGGGQGGPPRQMGGRPPQGGGGRQMGGRPPQGQRRGGIPDYGQETDPWSQNQQAAGSYDWGSGQEEEPPF